jgi:hypothetical protein
MEKSTKIFLGLAAVGLVTATYVVLKSKNSTNSANNNTPNTPDSTNTKIASQCKALSFYLKQCQAGDTSIWSMTCSTLAPYQKMCAPYI